MTEDLMQQETTDDADFSTLNGALGEIVALRATPFRVLPGLGEAS